jgi:hypothetical protein
MTSKPTNPFFEPGALLPAIPQLMLKTLLTYGPTNPLSILTCKELSQHFPVHHHIVLSPHTKQRHSVDSTSNDIFKLQSDSSEEDKIPKPPGELSHPSWGDIIWRLHWAGTPMIMWMFDQVSHLCPSVFSMFL